MAAFLSPAWFDELNDVLARAGQVPFEDPAQVVRVVLEFDEAPAAQPHALTFTIQGDGARVDAGDHLGADAVLRLRYDDALALVNGAFDSAAALREGRVKLRGYINSIVPVLGWLQQAHPGAE